MTTFVPNVQGLMILGWYLPLDSALDWEFSQKSYRGRGLLSDCASDAR